MPKTTINIFLPAAGLGERLRPITGSVPKPLLPVLGKPVLERILEKVSVLTFGTIGINLHYQGEMIRDWVDSSPYADRIEFFHEDPVLGTGGALKNAESLLLNRPFLVHNADVLSDIDLVRLVNAHLASGNIATLAMHNYTKFNTVIVDKNGYVIDVHHAGDPIPEHDPSLKKAAYTGIAVYSPKIFQFLPPGASPVTDAWIAAAKAGHKVQAFDVDGSYWNDIGTPASYAAGALDALRLNGETIYLSSTAEVGAIDVEGYAIIESGSIVENGARIRNCILLPRALVTGEHENRIIGPDYLIELTESEMQPGLHAKEQKAVSLSAPLFSRFFGKEGSSTSAEEEMAAAILIGMGGSERRYFRVRNGSATAVLMECRPDDPDYDRHLVYSRFFEAKAVPIPELISADDARKSALFEDLGDISLYSYLKLPRARDTVEEVYRRVMDILVILHTHATADISECPLLAGRIFDYDYLRWETDYFLNQFVIGLRKQQLENREALEAEFHQLAVAVDAFPKTVIHRDFQCQNVMITRGGIPRVIDYQGARMAPPAYDLASILWDPYNRIDHDLRERLLEHYRKRMDAFRVRPFDETLLSNSLLFCRLQRHMQALGAYGFLSEVRGKNYFLQYIPEALRLLKKETAMVKDTYPALCRLVQDME